MTWLLEERQASFLVIVVGIISVVLLATGWAKTGRKEILYALGVVMVVCAVLLALQRLIKTEGEQAEATLAQIARDVERNDLEAVLKHLHSTSSSVRAQAEAEFPKYKFTEVKITRIHEVVVNMKHQPPMAIVKFTVAVTGTDADGLLGGQTVWRYVEVTFHKEKGTWRVHSYTHDDPQRPFMKDK